MKITTTTTTTYSLNVAKVGGPDVTVIVPFAPADHIDEVLYRRWWRKAVDDGFQIGYVTPRDRDDEPWDWTDDDPEWGSVFMSMETMPTDQVLEAFLRYTSEHPARTFLVEKYEHGLVRYALTGESSAVGRQWDVAAIGFIVVPDTTDDPAGLARRLLESYTHWRNGNTYDVVIVTYDAEGNEVKHETSGMHYGEDSAVTELKELMQ